MAPSTRRLYPQELLKIAAARQASEHESPALPPVEDWPSVTVLVLTRDRLHLTRRCVESLYANSDYAFQLLIYDDGSQAETLAYLRHLRDSQNNVQRSQVRLIEESEPTGWGVARNRAFALATTDYVMSIDNDMICHPGWLREAMACAVRHQAAFVAPLRLNPDGAVWGHAADLIRTDEGKVLEIARWFHDLPLATVQSLFAGADVSANFVPGGAGLFLRDAFFECGGFDQAYQAGFEDLDLSLKLAARGYTVWTTERAVLTHDDQWHPLTAADVAYARSRYDQAALRASADHFKAVWGYDVLPQKYVGSFQMRLQGKLTHGN